MFAHLTTNPYLAMSLPDGGLMTVPLDTVKSPDSATASTATASTSLGQDVLSVTAGEPSTHFNLDQLLNIVQSFQLDTTHAAQEPGGQQEKKVCWSVSGSLWSLTVWTRDLNTETWSSYQALLSVG